ncbi:WLM-domain-containing protein [Bimuria novae-zelandiae CBS 107.79]|uniref:WLM-domain-containing protein n=1 Tax=Bimuria novae-zelandiae CBS 107.79 TaxID=1447943 RepID=A0A6A5VL98_9PLEO|nr:WLM-domain-containing protein [Bimuria novae-zelandiae CBS 107.79]
MPLGFERLNERTQRPNAHINFIRPLPGPTSTTAEAILNRVAAICYPCMKSHMILVQALEEFPFNTEFVGRNFNAGEVIQLVLRDKNGRWLPQRMVEMVMVHELAHCKQMNHSGAFWKVRNEYAVELRALWAKGYTGEGLWGRGRELDTGAVQMKEGDAMDIPEHVCGGTYARRARKRRRGEKTKENLTYAERKQRRILKKFGAGGQALGEEANTKVKLEGDVAKKGKPRVAGSARGRELRAAAALARFDTTKKEKVEIKKEETPSDSETEDDETELVEGEAAIDVDGEEMKDDKGRALVKICEEEDEKDDNARREMDELHGLTRPTPKPRPVAKSKPTAQSSNGALEPPKPVSTKSSSKPSSTTSSRSSAQVIHIDEIYKRRPDPQPDPPVSSEPTACAVCSMENEAGSITCVACVNVLNPCMDTNHWRCKSAACKGSRYINAGDVGRCGVCGASK